MFRLSLTMESDSYKTKQFCQIFNRNCSFLYAKKYTSRGNLFSTGKRVEKKSRGVAPLAPYKHQEVAPQTSHMSIGCAFPASSPNFLARKRPAAHEASESSCNPSSGTKSEKPNILWVEIEQQLPSYAIQISPLTSETIIFRFQGPVIKTGWWNPFPNSPHPNLGPRSTSSGFSRYCAGFRHRLQAPFDPKVSERFDAETPQRTQLRILKS